MEQTALPSYEASVPWWKEQPSLPRLLVFSVVVALFSVVTLVLGMTWIQTYVPVAVATGHDPFVTDGLPDPGELAFGKVQRRKNILVMGVDYNYTDQGILHTKGVRSDTILVVSATRDGQVLNVVSIPRDTWVWISDAHGYQKINAAFALGGVQQAMRTVSSFLGVKIDHYVVVKVDGATRVVDAVGHIEVDVEKDMDYDDNWGNLHIHLKQGRQTLTGQQAVGYARFRLDEEGDRGRMRRQQQVMRALMARIKEHPIQNGYRLARVARENVDTDLELAELADLARLYHDFDYSQIRGGTVVGDDAFIGEMAVIVPYEPENRKVIRRLLKDSSTLATDDLRIRILNASEDSQAGARLADHLNVSGFRVVSVEDAGERREQTRVLEHVQAPRAQGRLRRELAGANFVSAPKDGDWDVTVMVGEDHALRRWSPQPAYYQPATAIQSAYPAHAQPMPAPRELVPPPPPEPEVVDLSQVPVPDPPPEASPAPEPEPNEAAPEPPLPPPSQAEPPPPVEPVPEPKGDDGWFEGPAPVATPLAPPG